MYRAPGHRAPVCYDSRVTRPRTLTHLADTVTALLDAETDAAAFELALDATLRASTADMGAIFRPSGQSLRLTLHRNLPQAFRKRPPLLDTQRWGAETFVRTPQGGPTGAPLQEMAALTGIQTWATAPVRPRQTVHGLILLGSRDLVGFSDDAIAYLKIVAHVLGLALESASSAIRSGPPPVPTTVGPFPLADD